MAVRRSKRARQSTLTQMPDFLGTPRSSHISSHADEPSGDDEAHGNARKRKRVTLTEPRTYKRRAIKQEHDDEVQHTHQDTLTQNWSRNKARWDAHEPRREIDDSSGDESIITDSEPHAKKHNDDYIKNQSPVQRPQLSQSVKPVSCTIKSTINIKSLSSPVRDPQTPRRRRDRVIPSSQTPKSIRFENCSPEVLRILQRSPLQNRGTNLEREHRVKSSPHKQILHSEFGRASQPVSPNLRRKRRLKRVTTVQETQSDCFSSELLMSSPHSLRETQRNQENMRPDLDQEAELVHDSQNDDPDYEDDDFPGTFDPVNSALERDALRYANGSTQYLPLRNQTDDDDDQDAETVVETIELSGALPSSSNIPRPTQLGEHERSDDVLRHVKPDFIPPSTATTQTLLHPPVSHLSRVPSSQDLVPSTQSSQTSWHTPPTSTQMLSSSPFPLPPMTYKETAQLEDIDTMAPVVDLSLTLPPPMF